MANTNQRVHPFITLVVLVFMIFIARMSLTGFVYETDKKQERERLVEIHEIQVIELRYKGEKISFNGAEQERFLEELQGKPILPNHSHSLEEYEIRGKIIEMDQRIFEFLLYPDSRVPGTFWLNKEHLGNFKELRSKWLMQFFSEKGIFEHGEIVTD